MLRLSGSKPFARVLFLAAGFAAAGVRPLAAQTAVAAPILAAVPPETAAKGESGELRAPSGFPSIGLWMITRDAKVADWLGQSFRGKKLLEPINIIIMDGLAASAEEAVSRLVAACEKAGFPEREGHSSGYSALIGDTVFSQAPPGTEDCFSDAPFTFANDHGRVFGPLRWKEAYYFTAAFSREGVDLVTKVKHLYRSFDRARDTFAQAMSLKTVYRVSGFAHLGNDIPDDEAITTGDHDGMAVVLKAIR